jgi:hypothetical protein
MSTTVPSNSAKRRVPMGWIYDYCKERFIQVPAALIREPARPDVRPLNLPPAKP